MSNVKPVVTFLRGSQATALTLTTYGGTTSVTLQQGDDVHTSDMTVDTPLVTSPTKFTPNNQADLVAVRASSVFIYAGTDGAATRRSI